MTIPEITIHRKRIDDSLDRLPFDPRWDVATAEDRLLAADLVAQIGAAKASGARVLLVSIRNCEGGDYNAGEAVYRALRGFSGEGWPDRRVVVHVSGFAASTAAHIALAGDYLLMDRDARFYLHGAIVAGAAEAWFAESVRRMVDGRFREVALERSGIPPRVIDDALAYQFDPTSDKPFNCAELGADAAIAVRWADLLTDLDGARALAEALEAGGELVTPRRTMLLSRRADPLPPPLPRVRAECTIGADALAANSIRTGNYAEDGSGNPTAGAKLDNRGTALKVAAQNFQIGKTLVRDVWWAQSQIMSVAVGYYAQALQASALFCPAGFSTSWDATNWRLTLTFPSTNSVLNAAHLMAAVQSGTYLDSHGWSYYLREYAHGSGAGVYVTVELWRHWYQSSGSYNVDEKVNWPAVNPTNWGPNFNITVIAWQTAFTPYL